MRGIATVAGYVAAVSALAAAFHTIAGARGHVPAPSRVYLAFALGTIATALTLSAPGTLALTALFEPVPNITRLIGDALAMVAAFCVLAMLAHTVASPTTAVRRTMIAAIVLVGCVAAMVALLLRAHTQFTVEFATTYGDNRGAIVYEALYVAYMCWGMISFIWLIRRYARRDGDRLMRWGLRINMVAAGVGLTWAAWKIVNAVVVVVKAHPITEQAGVSELLGALVVGLIAAGVTLPSWARWALALAAAYRAWCAYRALTPLWTTLVREVPEVALPDADFGDGIDYALYRRVIEIRDAQLALRPYIPPDLPGRVAEAARAANLEPHQAARLVEATELAAAIIAHQAGHRYETNAARPGILRQRTPADLHVEARWLASLTNMMRRDTLIAELLERVSTGLPDQPLHTDPR